MGGLRGQLIPAQVKQDSINQINHAVASGARLHKACQVLGIGVRTYQRWTTTPTLLDNRKGPKQEPKNKLSMEEKNKILEICKLKEYCDLPPSQIVPKLCDRGQYIGSESSIYRVLKANDMQHHRSNKQVPKNNKPMPIIALNPNEVWSWDITYLPSPIRGQFYFLYMIMDIFSRMIVGWAIHDKESQEYAAELIEMTCIMEGVSKNTLILHSDNGSPMRGSTMLAKLQQLEVLPSFSRPRVSNDNPYSESLFGTMKYRPTYPEHAFASIEKANEWVAQFVNWYNTQHLHSGIQYVTPEDRHNGFDGKILANRKKVYEIARSKHPERWSQNIRNWKRVGQVALNPLKENEEKSIMKTVM